MRLRTSSLVHFFLSAAKLIAAARLEYDLRKLKVKCCRDIEVKVCSYQPIGQFSCPAGTQFVDEDGWECEPFCTEYLESLFLMSLGDIDSTATEQGLRRAVDETKLALTKCGRGDASRRRTASSARCNLAVVTLLRNRGPRFEKLAHRLLSWAVILDNTNEAAVNNLKAVGGSAACSDLAEDGDLSLDTPCVDVAGYHNRMLHDSRRNEAYQRAIKWAIAKKGKNSTIVVDIGAGSGILSLLAVQVCLRRQHPRCAADALLGRPHSRPYRPAQ